MMLEQVYILLVDSSYPINTRNEKIIVSLKQAFPHLPISCIAWNRDGRQIAEKDKNMLVYKQKSVYGKAMQKMIHLFGYYKFLKHYNKLYKPWIIVASHWDMLLLAAIFKSKEQILIYENLDIPTSSNKLVLHVLRWIEKFSLKRTDAIIFASRFFCELYDNFVGKKIVLENKPLIVQSEKDIFRRSGKDSILVISYIGLVRYAEIIKNLIVAVRNNPKIVLNIHGEGQDLAVVKEYARGCHNVYFTGRYELKDIYKLYKDSDLIWAAYPNKDYNVKYAISNKFHESLEYKVPCIFSDKTKLGDFVQSNSIGFIVNPYSVEAISSLLNSLINNQDALEKVKRNLHQYSKKEKSWNEDFAVVVKYIKSLDIKVR